MWRIGFLRSLHSTLLLLFLLIALVPLCVTSGLVYWLARDALGVEVTNQLTAVRDIKANQVNTYFRERFNGLMSLAESHDVIELLTKLNTLVTNNAQPLNQTLQTYRNLYLDKPDLIDAHDGSEYSATHAYYHQELRDFQQTYGYDDILLVEPTQGMVVYSTSKQDTFATSLIHGQYAKTNLAQVYKTIITKAQPEQIYVKDFAVNLANHTPMASIATPIMSHGELHGVLIFQLSIQAINALMQERSGMGNTGESYLIGTDFLMRSDSRFSQQSTILRQSARSSTAQKAFDGEIGMGIVMNYRGLPVLSAYKPLNIQGLSWVILVEKSIDEAFANANNLLWMLLTILAIWTMLVIGIALFFSNSLTQPLKTITYMARELAAGNMQQDIHVKTSNEIGTMAQALRDMVSNWRGMIDDIRDALARVSEGDQNIEFKQSFSGDFVAIQTALQHTAAKLAQATAENERQNWLKTGQAKLSAQLGGELSVQQLAENTLNFITPYIGAQVSTFYLLIKPSQADPQLKLIASYAYVQRAHGCTSFALGDGMVGQAAYERKMFSFVDLPTGYMEICSGVGSEAPREVVAVPLMYEDQLKGVIEIAALQRFTPSQLEFLQQIVPLVSVAVNTAQSRMRLETLLKTQQRQDDDAACTASGEVLYVN